jgi:hypothetical protein
VFRWTQLERLFCRRAENSGKNDKKQISHFKVISLVKWEWGNGKIEKWLIG